MTDDGLATTALQGRGADESGEMPLMVERFVIEDELGAGGMGRVYVAYDPTLDRRVALKLLRDRFGLDVDKAHARMAREARAMAKLRHPNVVTVHEVGTHERGVFIVMEYVAGGTLRAWLERDPAPDWKQIVAMYALAGRGLAAAHDAGLVHRDFKPDNVLVGDDGRVLVSDFGLANSEPGEIRTAVGSPVTRLTRAGSVMGTPPYMSPEQHQGKVVDARTDQFAFCAALYEALYGTRPFAGETDTDIAERAIRGEITPPIRDPHEPPRVRAAILRGLRAASADRFPSMAALLDELVRERRSPRRWIGLGAGVAIVAAVAVWMLLRGHAVAKTTPPGPIAVESFDVTLAHIGERPDWRDAVGDVIALMLGDIDGFKVIGPSELLGPDHAGARLDLRPAEVKFGARFIVRGAIVERAGRLYAHVSVVRPDGAVTKLDLERATSAELAQLIDDVTRAVAHAIAPDRALDPSRATIRAQALYRLGEVQLRNTNFQKALPYLEQVVVTDPKYFEGWYALALTRSWVLAPESRVFEAIEAARATAPTEIEKTLVGAIANYLHHDLTKAQAILEPLVANPALSQLELRDALYFLGEAHWHDGHHRVGVGYFRRALDIDMSFKLPIQHVSEYAAANRDLAMMTPYSAMISTSTSQFRDTGEFVAGHYEELARTGAPPARFHAMLVLGQTPPPELEENQLASDPLLHHIYRAARAIERGDSAVADLEIEAVWTDVLARKQSGELAENVYYGLRLLGDVVLCAELPEQARRIVTFLAAQSAQHPVRNFQRMSILTAPLVGDRALVVRRELTDRDRQLADAIDAELAGDRARAVELLQAIVHDPSPYWDYPERVALLRNLRALHRGKDVTALCDDTLHPALFQMAFLPARRACKAAR